jgi:hypothetical protein
MHELPYAVVREPFPRSLFIHMARTLLYFIPSLLFTQQLFYLSFYHRTSPPCSKLLSYHPHPIPPSSLHPTSGLAPWRLSYRLRRLVLAPLLQTTSSRALSVQMGLH